MRLAFIPPYENINCVMHTDYQLLLPQCLTESERYRKAYYRARRAGSYMILDNGVAESVEYDPTRLHMWADTMMVNEIVVPDTIGDTAATLQQAKTFHNWADNRFNYMGVVQGSTFDECVECIESFTALSYITVLGIPRHLLTTDGEDTRIRLVDLIRGRYDDVYKIHLLGMNPKYTNELISFGRAYKALGVRGIDTSAPFNYALANALLTAHAQQIARPGDYFNQHIADSSLCYINMAIMKDWVYSNV